MKRTAFVTALFFALAFALGSWLTLNFSVWTAEGARRQRVLQAPVAAPAMDVVTAAQVVQPLAAFLADGRKVTVVTFFYARCPSICLSLGNTLQQMQAALQNAPPASHPQPAVRLLSISFDPAHDGPATLRAYSLQMRADPAVWQFATPVNDAALRALLARWGVVVIPDGQGGFEHNAALLVLNPQGQLVRIFDDTDSEAALAYAHHLAAMGRKGGEKG